MFGSKTLALQKRAQEIIPLGVNSNFRYWGDQITPYVDKAKGAYLYDTEGKKYIDYVGSWGPMILGHTHPDVIKSVKKTAEHGLSFGAPTRIETQMAQKICELMPAIEKVRAAPARLQGEIAETQHVLGDGEFDELLLEVMHEL